MMISIITCTYNSERTLPDALASIRAQSYKNIELVVVDGGSSDKTLEIIKSNSDLIAKYVSENDKGIYDALNKGISLSSGDIIGILHSDDYYSNESILESVHDAFDPEVDAIYGDLDYVDRNDTNRIIRKWKGKPYDMNDFYFGWMPAHPTFFLRASKFAKYGMYNLDFYTAADYELMLRMLLKHKVKAKYLPTTLVKMRVGGQSNVSWKNRWIANKEDAKAWAINGLTPRFYTRWLKPISKLSQFLG